MPRLLAFVLLLLILIAGCTSRQSESPAVVTDTTVTDALGREVALKRPVERVVTLAPNLTEIVFAAGAGPKVVGVTTADDHPPAVDTLPRFSALPIDFEAVTALQPELVLATDQVNAPRDTDTFAALNIPVYFFSFTSLDDVLDGIRTTGALLSTRTEAEATVDSLHHAIEQLEDRTAAVEDRPLVLFLIGDETLYAFGGESYIHTLIRLAGGRSATADLDAEAPILSEEFVLETKPEVIIGTFGENYDPERLLEFHPSWDVVPALQEGRVYSIDEDLVQRPGPRLVEGARRMARLLHPKLFDSR